MWQQQPGNASQGPRERLFHVALFVPNDSSLVALPSAAAKSGGGSGAGASSSSYEWQGELLSEWVALDAQCAAKAKAPATSQVDLACIDQGQVEALVVATGEREARALESEQARLVLPAARVVESISAAIGGVAAADAALGGARIHLFCE